MNKFKQYTIEYSFIGSVWSKETIIVTSNNLENAKERARIEINMAYGSEICKDLIIH
jgi:allophanate hydrolase subunit 1